MCCQHSRLCADLVIYVRHQTPFALRAITTRFQMQLLALVCSAPRIKWHLRMVLFVFAPRVTMTSILSNPGATATLGHEPKCLPIHFSVSRAQISSVLTTVEEIGFPLHQDGLHSRVRPSRLMCLHAITMSRALQAACASAPTRMISSTPAARPGAAWQATHHLFAAAASRTTLLNQMVLAKPAATVTQRPNKLREFLQNGVTLYLLWLAAPP